MSFRITKKLMEEGDTVLLYLGYDNFVQMQLTRGGVHQTRFGAIKHEQLIGTPYGVKVECPKGWVYPLQPTSELWTLALPHRTQILYTPDISVIVLQLYLKPGCVVVEAGVYLLPCVCVCVCAELVSKFITLTTPTLLVCAGLFEHFCTQPNSNMDYRDFDIYIYKCAYVGL